MYRKTHGLPMEQTKSPAECGETFGVPVGTAIKQGDLFEAFEKTISVQNPIRGFRNAVCVNGGGVLGQSNLTAR